MADIKIINVTDYPEQYSEVEHILVDVREEDEYAGGHLPGAINHPLSTLQQSFTQIPTDKAVLLVCKTGGRSQMAAEFLKETGKYPQIVNLDGGTMGWIEAGNPVEK